MLASVLGGLPGTRRRIATIAVAMGLALAALVVSSPAHRPASGATVQGSGSAGAAHVSSVDAWFNDPGSASVGGIDAWFNDPQMTTRRAPSFDAWFADPAGPAPQPGFDAWFNDR